MNQLGSGIDRMLRRVVGDEYVSLSIAGSGSGLTADTLDHIFEPLFTTKPSGEGTGLGLSMLLGIVQQSDGHIQVETQIGDGNVFRVLLPRAGHQRTYAADVEDAEVFNAASGNAVVLVLEDEPTLRSIVARNLPDRGYEVLEANHGEAAVEHARQRPDIRLFLSDVVLPRPSGPSIAAKIREADPALRVVFMSGFTDGERTRHPSRTPMRHSWKSPSRAIKFCRRSSTHSPTRVSRFKCTRFFRTNFSDSTTLPCLPTSVHRCSRRDQENRMPVHFSLPDDSPNVALVTLDRPEARNALDPEMLSALAAAWRRIADDDAIRCAVLTGTGSVFCSGMDMKKTIPASHRLASGEKVSEVEFEGLRSVKTALLAGFDLQTPLVCALNGHARAGGFDLMLASEIRYAVPEATFALEEVALGLYPTGNATVLLPRQIGWAHAHELLLSAAPIDAERALAYGLINEIVEADALLSRALAMATRIAANAPLAVRATRAGVRELLAMPLDEAYVRQEELGKPLRKTEDAREAQQAFVEKRPPRFTGR